MISDYFLMAWKSLKHRGVRSWLTMLGIFIGIAAVVALISLGQGLETAVTGQFSSLSVDTLTLQNKGSGFGPPGSSVAQKLTDNDVEIVESITGVEMAVPRYVRVIQLNYNDISGFNYASNLPKEDNRLQMVYGSFNIEAEEGDLLRAGERGKVLLGSDVAKSKRYDKELRVGSKINIEGELFKVSGILKPTSSFQVNTVILIPEEDMKDILNIEDNYDLIAIKVVDKNEVSYVAEKIEEELRSDRDEDIGEESFSVQTPLQALSSVNTILNIINIIVVGIALISLFVGGVGITNTMYTSVIERKKEIGVMKAVGAKNEDVLKVFLIESGVLGLVGGIIGAIIGLGLAFGAASAANNFFGDNIIQVAISWPLLIGAIGFSFFVGIISGTLPARQASKLNVVDALRN
jgi:putative ABC transport system permease protein